MGLTDRLGEVAAGDGMELLLECTGKRNNRGVSIAIRSKTTGKGTNYLVHSL